MREQEEHAQQKAEAIAKCAERTKRKKCAHEKAIGIDTQTKAELKERDNIQVTLIIYKLVFYLIISRFLHLRLSQNLFYLLSVSLEFQLCEPQLLLYV